MWLFSNIDITIHRKYKFNLNNSILCLKKNLKSADGIS